MVFSLNIHPVLLPFNLNLIYSIEQLAIILYIEGDFGDFWSLPFDLAEYYSTI